MQYFRCYRVGGSHRSFVICLNNNVFTVYVEDDYLSLAEIIAYVDKFYRSVTPDKNRIIARILPK